LEDKDEEFAQRIGGPNKITGKPPDKVFVKLCRKRLDIY